MRYGGWMLVGVLWLIGCTDSQQNTPGPQGPLVLRHWNRPGQPPSIVVAKTAASLDGEIENLDLQDLRARLPILNDHGQHQGWIALDAPRATLRQIDNQQTVILEGPVRIHGHMQGANVVGHAARVSLRQNGDDLSFEQLVLVHDGLCTSAARARLQQRHILTPESFSRNGQIPADLAAQLALLPESYQPADPSK